MKFSIITPTFKRPEILGRTIESVISQSHSDWEMLVINDNPGDSSSEVIKNFNDYRIKFFENKTNSGVNFSRNYGLENVVNDSEYVIFLDDDDYLAPEALYDMAIELTKQRRIWLMTAVGNTTNSSLTISFKGTGTYSYAWDYLITKKIKGDATHCINSDLINGKQAKLRFPTKIKQAEEWLFYFELSKYSKIYYVQIVTKLINDYSKTGLNLRKRATKEQLRTLSKIFAEARSRDLLLSFHFWIYFTMRFVRSLIK